MGHNASTQSIHTVAGKQLSSISLFNHPDGPSRQGGPFF